MWKNKLSFKSSRLWGSLYLLMIPLYAVVYCLLPLDSFNQQTSRLDVSLNEYGEELLQRLEDECRLAAIERYDSTLVLFDGWQFDWKDVSLTNLEANDEEPRVLTAMGMFNDLQKLDERGTSGLLMPVEFYINVVSYTPDNRVRVIVNLPANSFEVPLGALFVDVDKDRDVTGEGGKAVLSKNLFSDLKNFWYAQNGWVWYAPGRFGRALHLSITTITTSGYGDLVPTRSFAKMLIASQAVLGIIIAGLFLACIGKKVTEARYTSD